MASAQSIGTHLTEHHLAGQLLSSSRRDRAITALSRFSALLAAAGLIVAAGAVSARATPAPPTAVIATLATESQPSSVVVNTTTGEVYVANEASGTITVIDGATNSVAGPPIQVGGRPLGMAFNPQTGLLYVSDPVSRTVSVVDVKTRSVVGPPIMVGVNPVDIEFNATNGNLYVVNAGDGTLTVIDGDTNLVIGPPVMLNAYIRAVAINPDNGDMFVVNHFDDAVSVVDSATNTVIGTPIRVGNLPVDIEFNTENGHIYVLNYFDGSVSVIDSETYVVIGEPLAVGGLPMRAAFNPHDGKIYLTDASGGLAVIDGDTVVDIRIPTGDNPYGIAASPLYGTLYVSQPSKDSLLVVGAAPTITSGAPTDGSVDAPYTFTLTASALPDSARFTVTDGDLPSGLTLDRATGAITGTPTAAGSSTFTIAASNGAAPDAAATYTISIAPAPLAAPIITTSSLPNAVQGASYQQTINASGASPIIFAVTDGVLPTGLELDAATGRITGTPTALGSSTFTVTATNGAPQSAVATFTISVAEPPVVPPTGPPQTSAPAAQTTLAVTGQPFAPEAAVGTGLSAALLVAGLALLVITRARRAISPA